MSQGFDHPRLADLGRLHPNSLNSKQYETIILIVFLIFYLSRNLQYLYI